VDLKKFALLDGAMERDQLHVEPVSFARSEIGRILVDVHQVVRDLAGEFLSMSTWVIDSLLEHGLICYGPLPSSQSPNQFKLLL